MTADVALLDGATRVPLDPPVAATVSYGEHGLESVQLQYRLNRWRAFSLINRTSAQVAARVTQGGQALADARVEDIAIDDQGATVQALGRWRALRDAPLTAFYSKATLDGFRPVTASEIAGVRPERFYFETAQGGESARLVIATEKGATYTGGNRVGALVYEVPDDAAGGIAQLTFDLAYNVPAAGWTISCIGYTAFGSAVTFYSVSPGGAATVTTTVAVSPGITRAQLAFFLTAPAGYTEAQETGDNYLTVSNLRMSSLVAGFINTTLGTAVAAPGAVVVTPASMAGIYVGQRLYVDQQTAQGESVVVTAITATTFTATFAKTHLSTATVRAITLYADAVAKDVRDQVNSVNPGALSASNALISSPALDVLTAVYEDADAGDVLSDLAALGDMGGQRYEVGADRSTLYFRPQGSAGQAWYVDATSLEVQQTLDQLYNSVYARYERADGFALRTPPQDDAVSQQRYGLTRRRAVDADTSNATTAARVAQTSRDDTKNPVPRASLSFSRVYTAAGAAAPLLQVRNGDTITIRNLPPVAGPVIDLIRTFRVFDCQVDLIAGTLSVTPETPLPLLEYLLARQTAFGDIAAGRLAR